MSIVTKTGDTGETSLMYGRRVSKADSQVEARHTQEMQVMFEQLDMRDKQVRNFYLTNAALNR